MSELECKTVIHRNHPAAPLADWLVWLIEHARPATDGRPFAFAETRSCADVASRLRAITAVIEAPDICAVHALLEEGKTLFDVQHVLDAIRQRLALAAHDPAFPWHADFAAPRLSSPEDYVVPWRLREELRFADGTYRAVPWAKEIEPIPDHYVHISLDHDHLIAFTETPEKGEKDIQTPIKPARYLRRFYQVLPDHEVRDLAARLDKVVALRFAVTADDIERIYTSGPTSCMSKDESDYESFCHPVRVYGDSDLQLAYITDECGEPVARALVWPEKMRHSRVYGHETLMCQQLQRAGYAPGSLRGARIRRIADSNDPDRLVMPYLDDARSFDILDNDWLTIGGPYAATMTEGLATSVIHADCERCMDSVPEDDLRIVVDAGDWCQACRDQHAFTSDRSGDLYCNDDRHDVVTARHADGRLVQQEWSTSERDDHAIWCEITERDYDRARFSPVTLYDGRQCVDFHFAEHGDPSAPDTSPDDPVQAPPPVPEQHAAA